MTIADPYEGLPAHMLESIPVTIEVTVEYASRPAVGRMSNGEPVLLSGLPPRIETHQVQLERGGKSLTVADRRGWTTGERGGWRARPSVPEQASEDAVIDVDGEQVHE